MKKIKSQPYQPLLLRILHDITTLCVVLAILTAFWTYNTYDGRWGRILLPSFKEIEGIHGTFGLFSLLILPVFAVYAFHCGQKRLIQVDSFTKLLKIGKPLWWYNIHRFTNTLAIFTLTFAVFSGKMMDEKWLPNGELNHFWYYLHLVSWVVMVISILLHLLIVAKVGGVNLFLSMFNSKFRVEDNPNLWLQNIVYFWHNKKTILTQEWLKLSPHFKVLEIIVIISIIMAWIISVFK